MSPVMNRLPGILLALVALMSWSPASAQNAAPDGDSLKKAQKLHEQGNHREAADLAKTILAATPDATLAAEALDVADTALNSLYAYTEKEQVVQDAAKRFPKSWRVLRQAAHAWGSLPTAGNMVEGQYRRNDYNSRGPYVDSSLQDRVRMLQWLESAMRGTDDSTPVEDRKELLEELGEALMGERDFNEGAWSLLALTDISKLPDFNEQSGLDSPAGGYPVDPEGNPIFFKTGPSWEKSANDGERLLWIMEEIARLSPDARREALQQRAELAKSWFSVRSLADLGFRPADDEKESARQDGIATLHTLKDDETVAKLASGPKRFTLPPEWSFMSLYRKLAEDASAPGWHLRVQAWREIAGEHMDRRQFTAALAAWKEALALEKDEHSRKDIEQQIHQITGNLGNLEGKAPMPAGSEAKIFLTFRNAKKVAFTARKVDVARLLADTEAYLRTSPQDQQWDYVNVARIGSRLLAKDGDKYLSKVSATWEQDLAPRANHWDRRVEITTPLKDAGAWLVEGKFDGGHVTRALVWLEGLVLVQTRQASAGHYFVADAVTGAPVAGAKLRFFGYRQEWKDNRDRNAPRLIYYFKDFQMTSDAEGQVVVKGNDVSQFQWLITASTEDKRLAYLGFEGLYFGDGRERFNNQTRLYTITDRPVYRPGQEVKWKLWARTVGYDSKLDTNNFAKARLTVRINDPRGEKLSEKTYTADDSGAVSDVLVLGEEAALGAYSMQVSTNGLLGRSKHLGGHQFRVEEYKKPEFEVKVDAPSTPVALGDKFEVKVKADYYFGGPVKEGKVKYKVERSAHESRWFPAGRWDWLFGEGYGWRATYYAWYPGAQNWCMCMPRWPWVRWQSDPPELVAEGESPLNPDGTFTIRVDTALAKELHGDEDHKYSIQAEVTDQSRRTIFGNGSVLASRRPFEVYVSLDRGYYQAGEEGKVHVNARTLDGRSVKATGALKLLRVTYAKDGTPQEEEVASFPLTSGEEPTTQSVKWERGGQYRVAVKLKDEGGHEVEGISFVTVRGAGFEEGKDFRFDDLELLVQKDDYAPGDEVELTVNTNRPGSTVALFLRAQNSVYPAPVWLKLEGKSTTYRFKLTEADQPNIFLDAYTVSNARVHAVTKQVVVPPKKRIATVELEPDCQTYLPGQGSKVKVRVKDQDGKPFTGQVVLTAYDKALEYISGGSNQEDIRPFFWGWKRSHYPQVSDSLRWTQAGLAKEGERSMETLGAFGNLIADLEGDSELALSFGGGASRRNGRPGMARARMAGMDAFAAMPASAPAPMSVAEAAPLAKSAMPMAAAAPAPVVVTMDEEGPVPMIRSNLADAAVWVADLRTDANGEGEMNFNLPDNLTTWKLRSWVMGPDAQVGEAAVEVITRKNLMVRLQAPRFFVEKDEVVISANVHNEMDVAQDVKAVLELEGGVLAFLEPGTATTGSVKLAAHSEKRFDWRVKVTGEGEAKVRVKALAQKDADAMEMTFPAYTHGMLKTDSWSLALRADQASGSLKVKVPAERKPEQSRLEVRYSPTLAMALVDALPYLADYPYGCTEQTLNRFLPTVLTLRVIKDLGVNLEDVRAKRTNLNAQEIGDAKKRGKRWQGKDSKGQLKEAVFDEEEVRKMAKAGLDRLQAMRGPDGGWGWFPGGRESSPHITALVLHGLKAAEQSGFDVNDGLIRSAVETLAQHEKEELRRLALPAKDRLHKPYPDNLDAMIHSVLVENKSGDAAMRAKLYEHRAKLSRYNLALLGLACHQVKETERRDMCLRNLRQFLKQDDENQTAYLELPQGGWWWYWYEDQIETQAAFLRLLCAVEPKGETAARIAKYLLNNRRNGTYWNSTKDTAAVIEALAVFAKASGESKPDQTLEVLVDGKVVKKVEITRENLFSFDGTVVLEGEEVTTGEHTVELRKLGNAPLYVNAYLTVFTQEDMIPAAGLEVKARRKFFKLIEEKPEQQVAGSRGQVVTQTGLKYRREELASGTPLKSGDLIEVELTVESKNDYEYVLLEDLKPAGFEPVEVRSGWSYEGLPSYQEYRDEKVAFFADRLPRGTHTLSYRVKAEIPGRFSALPAKVEAMYAPELKGNSVEWKAVIRD